MRINNDTHKELESDQFNAINDKLEDTDYQYAPNQVETFVETSNHNNDDINEYLQMQARLEQRINQWYREYAKSHDQLHVIESTYRDSYGHFSLTKTVWTTRQKKTKPQSVE